MCDVRMKCGQVRNRTSQIFDFLHFQFFECETAPKTTSDVRFRTLRKTAHFAFENRLLTRLAPLGPFLALPLLARGTLNNLRVRGGKNANQKIKTLAYTDRG